MTYYIEYDIVVKDKGLTKYLKNARKTQKNRLKMKTIIFVLTLLSFITISSKADSILRIPKVSVEFGKRIASMDTNHCVLTENTWSNPNSSIERKSDYFVVGSVKEDGARILQMNPFKTDSNGVEQPPRFTDIVTGEERVLPYQTVDNRKNGGSDYYHHGFITIGEDKYYVVVAYEGDMQHPVVMITWGKGSDILNPGEMTDSFEVIATETVTEQKVTISKVTGQDGVPDGVYLFVDSPKAYGEFKLMGSTDLVQWAKSEMSPYIIYGNSVIYKITEKTSFFKVE